MKSQDKVSEQEPKEEESRKPQKFLQKGKGKGGGKGNEPVKTEDKSSTPKKNERKS